MEVPHLYFDKKGNKINKTNSHPDMWIVTLAKKDHIRGPEQFISINTSDSMMDFMYPVASLKPI